MRLRGDFWPDADAQKMVRVWLILVIQPALIAVGRINQGRKVERLRDR